MEPALIFLLTAVCLSNLGLFVMVGLVTFAGKTALKDTLDAQFRVAKEALTVLKAQNLAEITQVELDRDMKDIAVRAMSDEYEKLLEKKDTHIRQLVDMENGETRELADLEPISPLEARNLDFDIRRL